MKVQTQQAPFHTWSLLCHLVHPFHLRWTLLWTPDTTMKWTPLSTTRCTSPPRAPQLPVPKMKPSPLNGRANWNGKVSQRALAQIHIIITLYSTQTNKQYIHQRIHRTPLCTHLNLKIEQILAPVLFTQVM